MVEWKKLGEACTIIRGNRVTKGELVDNGKFPVISGGVTPMGFIDSYNREQNLNFYRSNGFEFLMEEDDEKRVNGLGSKEKLQTRFMVFDLLKYYLQMQMESEE